MTTIPDDELTERMVELVQRFLVTMPEIVIDPDSVEYSIVWSSYGGAPHAYILHHFSEFIQRELTAPDTHEEER